MSAKRILTRVRCPLAQVAAIAVLAVPSVAIASGSPTSFFAGPDDLDSYSVVNTRVFHDAKEATAGDGPAAALEAERLEAAGYDEGGVRKLRGPAGSSVTAISVLWVFAKPAGAKSQIAHERSVDVANTKFDPKQRLVQFHVAGIPGAVGVEFVNKRHPEGEGGADVFFRAGRCTLLFGASAPKTAAARAATIAGAKALHERIGGNCP